MERIKDIPLINNESRGLIRDDLIGEIQEKFTENGLKEVLYENEDLILKFKFKTKLDVNMAENIIKNNFKLLPKDNEICVKLTVDLGEGVIYEDVAQIQLSIESNCIIDNDIRNRSRIS